MSASLRSALVFALGVSVAIGVSTGPTRAADGEKALKRRVKALEDSVAALEAKLAYMRVEEGTINSVKGPHVIFEGCNVHVRSGSGSTTDGTVDLETRTVIPDTTPTGLGNLIVGYNENPGDTELFRPGSHNLIVGPYHAFTSVGGVVFGQENDIYGPLSVVSGGFQNDSAGYAASVSGGQSNVNAGKRASVSGGINNAAEASFSSVSGGNANVALSGSSSVSGGFMNEAQGDYASVSGGSLNVASGSGASVSGGNTNAASGDYSSVSGGLERNARGTYDWAAGSLSETE